ncbi:Chromosome partition protein Smc [Streptococcus infantarius subsp. infantarius]|nr:Chromosome partition protein Smc [Streptococcus infantarius subsp. infantarius]
MSKNNVRIAIRDSTDSHNVAFFDNKAGIKYKSANLHRFLAGSASILTIKYNSKDIDSIRSGCKLAFRYKNRDYWLNVMSFEKKGFEVELTAYSLGLELNNETRGEHKPANAMPIAEYVAYYDPEHALTIGVNEVSDKRIKLEWTGTDTILARLFSVANSFGAELDFNVELNDDYSLKRQVLNIYKKGNLDTNKVSQPVRVGKELKVINYSDNIKELRTAVRATGKDGLTIDGLNKKIYDNNKELLYYSSGMTVYAPQSRDRFPSVGKGSNDNWIVEDLGETQYETKEALWGYMYGEIQKKSLPEITYEVEGAIEAGIGDTQTLIDDIHFEPALYVQARVSELEDDILTGKVTNSTFINFERKYSQIADSLLKQVEALAEDAAPYIVRLSTDNGYNFKNGQGSSTITAKLEKYSKIVNADWKWLINNSIVSETSSVTINASQVIGTLNVVAVAIVDGNEVAREYITFTNSDDGVGIKSIKRYYTTNDQAEGVTAGGQNWSTKPTTVTADKNYMWSYDVITYTNDTSLVTEPAVIGARGDDGLDADTTGITEALDKAKQELTALSANIEKVRDDSLAAVEEAKQQLATVANDLSKAKTDLQNAVSAVDTKATNLQSDLTKAKQDLTSQASQLQAQASAQSELTKRVSSVEETANGTKTTVSELSKTVDSNTKNITSVTARTKVVEDDLTSTKTTLSQVQTTADGANQKTATLETGLNGLNAKFETLKIGSRNYFKNSKSRKYYIDSTETQDVRTFIDDEFWQNDTRFTKNYVRMSFDIAFNPALPSNFTTNVHFSASPWYNCDGITFTGGTTALQHFDLKFDLSGASKSYKTDNVFIRLNNTLPLNTAVSLENFNLYLSAVVEDYSQNEADIESKVAEYKQTAEQNYASLQSNLQTLDGTVKQNKSEFDQTAQGFSTRIESLETYKDGETTRANQYFESAKTETARQLTAERTAIAKDYVAKSTYTSDVTGIRNDLTATTTTANTTKTNLANYQASNDKAVANLQSNLQTANGNISSLQTKVEAVPGQITSAVSSVEGKIPTSLDSLNLMTGTRDWSTKINKWHMGANWSTESDEYQGLKVHSTQKGYNGSHQNIFVKNGDIVTFSFFAKATNTLSKIKVSSRWPDSSVYQAPLAGVKESDEQITITSEWKRYSKTVHIISDGSLQFRTEYDGSTIPDGNTFYIAGLKLAKSALDTGYSENPTDAASDISKLNTALTQTANGLEQLSTQVTSQGNTITSHTNSINSLTTGLSAKVSQSDFNTLSGRVTTAENNITAKANELSSKISSVEGQIPSGEMNLVEYGRPADGYSPYNYAEYATHSFYYNSAYKMYIIKNTATSEKTFGMNRFKVERNTDYTLYFKGFNNSAITHMDVWFLKRVNGSTKDFDSAQILVSGRKLSASKAEDVSVTFNTGNYDEGYIRFDNNGSTTAGTQADLYFGDVSVKKGKSNNGWSPSLAELASSQDLKSAQSEIKQTTDAITASVSSVQTAASNAQSTANTAVSKADAAQAGVNTLDNTTVKTATLNLDNNGFVTKVGKTVNGNTFATMIAQNESDVQIIAKKMKVSGDMIVNGAITAEKLNVSNLSAVNSNLGKIEGGSLLLQENKAASSSIDSWGTFNRPAHKQGLYMDNHGLASSGAIQRKNSGETMPTDMPLAVLQSGELRFLVVDYNDNLENVLHYGLSDPDFGAIRFEIDSELKRRLTMMSSGYLNFQATNYTNWTSTGVNGCEYMIQGRLVLVNYDVTFNSAGTHTIGGIPQEFTKKSLMMTAKAWTITPRDKNIQLNSDGTLHILDAEANVNYRGTLVFSY